MNPHRLPPFTSNLTSNITTSKDLLIYSLLHLQITPQLNSVWYWFFWNVISTIFILFSLCVSLSKNKLVLYTHLIKMITTIFPLAYLLFICTYTTCSIRYWRSSRIDFSLTLLAFLPSVLSFNRPSLIVLALTCSKLRASRGCLHSRLVRTWIFHLPLSIMQALFQIPSFLYLKVSGDFLFIYPHPFYTLMYLRPTHFTFY